MGITWRWNVASYTCAIAHVEVYTVSRFLSLPSSFQNLYRGRSIPALIRVVVVGLEETRILKIYPNKNYATTRDNKKNATRREKPKASRVCREAEGFSSTRREAEGFERGEVCSKIWLATMGGMCWIILLFHSRHQILFFSFCSWLGLEVEMSTMGGMCWTVLVPSFLFFCFMADIIFWFLVFVVDSD